MHNASTRYRRTPLAGAPADLDQLDRDSLLHPFTNLSGHLERGGTLIVEGDGVRVRDSQGRSYLDAMAGLWCVNVGYGRDEIAEAIAEQVRRLPFFHSFASMGNEPSVRLAAKLLELSPVPMARAFFGLSGSDANDSQIKLVWRYNNLRGQPDKKKIVSRHGGYHGVTLGAGSLTGLPAIHRAFDLPLPGFLHVSTPHFRAGEAELSESDYVDQLANELDERIRAEGPESVAAFIAEPVMGAGGVIVPPTGYFERIQEVLREHDVLMIADEVICGFGRLGHWFGSEAFGIRPDLMTLAKGLTSGYLPMSACLISEPIWQVLRDAPADMGPFTHGFTYSGHPASAAAALANLNILEREGLVAAAAKTGAELQRRLRESFTGHAKVREVRGIGMMAAIEPRDPGDTARAQQALHDAGILTRAVAGTCIALSPPLILNTSELDELMTALQTVFDRL
ncbi:MAG: aminotransferase class III-fold pyridoxal phosphate-dependent enzyme [bacterium]|nr:aminotransferase class III-fold pyridoxal phosphate-dependent enzyme [bacterium]